VPRGEASISRKSARVSRPASAMWICSQRCGPACTLRWIGHRRFLPIRNPAVRESLAVGLLMLALLGVTASSFAAGRDSTWRRGAAPAAPFCVPPDTPAFHFGFAELSKALGAVMGQPTECEHGDTLTDDVFQATTTGVAIYHWCTNTPTFTRGQDRWMLTPNGLEHWTGQASSPRPLPIVRGPDLRHPCGVPSVALTRPGL
jgi:hypothetical protein